MENGSRIGKYALEEKLGEGGNGQVFAARDSVLGRRVALKLLHGQLITDATVAGRFRQEAQAMAQLSHPNVVVMHDFVSDGPRWAIVMELVENGETLGSIIKREGRLAPARAVRIAMGVAAALGHAHARGIVHRDVKPANVLLVRDHGRETAKLTDFGIARVMHGERRTGAQLTLGTLWYIAPEQAQSSGVDARADVYSLGATLYEAITGRVIFPYDNVARVLAAHIGETPPSPAQLVAGITPTLDRLVMRCIAKNPDERPAHGDALRALLEDCLSEIEGSGAGIPATRAVSEMQASIDAARARAGSVRPVALPAPFVSTPPAPSTTPSNVSAASGRLGLYIGLGTLTVVTGACLFGALLFVVTLVLR